MARPWVSSSFCERHRDRPDGATDAIYTIGKFSTRGADATAVLSKAGDEGSVPQALSLRLTAYADGVVRVHVDEPKAPRYAVPDVLVDGLERRKAPFKSVVVAGDRTVLTTADPDVVVTVGPARYCSPHHATQLEPLFIE